MFMMTCGIRRDMWVLDLKRSWSWEGGGEGETGKGHNKTTATTAKAWVGMNARPGWRVRNGREKTAEKEREHMRPESNSKDDCLLVCKVHRFDRRRRALRLCPVDCKQRSLQELLVRIFLAHVLSREIVFSELVDQELVSGEQLCLGITRVEDERLILSYNVSHTSQQQKRQLAQSPPSIRRALYMPTAATRLGFARKKR